MHKMCLDSAAFRLPDGGEKILKSTGRYLEAVQVIAAVAIAYLLMFSLGITCPIKYITGVSCAGCGMTRAWLGCLRGDIRTAFMYHPLFPLPALLIPVFLLRRKIPRRILRILEAAVCIVFILVYIKRLCDPQDLIVVFEPKKGLIGRIIQLFWNYSF